MQRAIDRVGQLLIGGDREEHVAGLDRDFVFVKIVVLQQLDVVERAFDQRLGTGLAVFFEQVLFQAAGIDADADRAAIGLGGAHNLAHAFGRADIAGVDAQAGGAGIGGFQRALVMEMDVGDDRYLRRADDLAQRGGALDIGAGHPDQVRARILATADLGDGGAGVGGQRVSHGLDGNRGVTAHGHAAHHDLPAAATRDIAPGSDG